MKDVNACKALRLIARQSCSPLCHGGRSVPTITKWGVVVLPCLKCHLQLSVFHVGAAGASVWYFSRAFWRKRQPSIVLGNKLATSLVQVLQALQMLARAFRVTSSSDWIRCRSRWVCHDQGSFYHSTIYQQHTISFGFLVECSNW